MWLITDNKHYLSGASEGEDATRIATITEWTEIRENAKLFDSKKQAQDFKEEFYIQGSIIPA